MNKLASKDWLSAILIFSIGLAATIGGFNYPVGSISSMGAGYFPIICGVTLIITSIIILFQNKVEFKKSEENSFRKRLRPWLAIVTGMVSFVILSQTVGLLISSFLLVFISSKADRRNNFKRSFILSSCLTFFVFIIFHHILQIQIPLFW